jgi:hypothetical protein
LRTIRRYPGGAVVAVQLRDRPFADVASDMVEGVLAVNRLDEAAAARMRPLLCQAVDPGLDQPAAA